MKWRTNLIRKTLPLPWLHPLRTAPFYLAKKETNAAPIHRPRYQFVRAAMSPPSSAPPSSVADFPKSAVPVVHTAAPSLLSAAPPSSVPPPLSGPSPASSQCPSSTPLRRPCCLRRPRRPCRRAAPVVRTVPGQLALPVKGRSDLRDGTGSSLRQEPGRPSLAVRIPFDRFLVAFVDLVSLISSARGRQ
jgi:hypothetical protein